MPRAFLQFSILLFGLASSLAAQQAIVPGQKEAERLHRQSMEEGRYNREYFDEERRCRALISEKKYAQAEASCRRSIAKAEKLPPQQVLERTAGYIGVGRAMVHLGRPKEAILQFQRAIEIGSRVLDDTDSEMGEMLYLLGTAYFLAGDTTSAAKSLARAEAVYRAAFASMEGDPLVDAYAAMIKRMVEAQLVVAERVANEVEAQRLRERLAQVEKDFAKHLKPGN